MELGIGCSAMITTYIFSLVCSFLVHQMIHFLVFWTNATKWVLIRIFLPGACFFFVVVICLLLVGLHSPNT